MNFVLLALVLGVVVNADRQVKRAAEIQHVSFEKYPFVVYVTSKRAACTGILISEYYVITPASCFYRSTGLKVYLERNLPSHEKCVPVREIAIHENFTTTDSNRYFNDIALLKLSTAATSIEPAILGFTNTSQGAVNVIGWMSSTRSDLGVMQVHLASPETCDSFIQHTLRDQEFCLKWPHAHNKLDLAGNALSLNGKIVGFMKPSRPFPENEPLSVELNLSPFLGWISDVTGVRVNKLLGEKEKAIEEHNECVCQLGELEREFKEFKEKVAEMDKTLRSAKAEIANLTEQINKINDMDLLPIAE